MKNYLTIAYYELKRLFRDSRLILIVVSQPIIIALIAGLMAYQDPTNIKIGLIVKNDHQYTKKLENRIRDIDKFNILNYQKVETDDIKLGKVRAFVTVDVQEDENIHGKVEILNDPAGGIVKSFVNSEIAKAVADTSKEIALENVKEKINQSQEDIKKSIPWIVPVKLPEIKIEDKLIESIKLDTKDITPFDLKHFDYFASAIMVLLVILVVLNLSGISITSERVTGTFERLTVTPYSKMDIIFGKALAQFLMGMMVVVLGIGGLYLMFHITIGNLFLIFLINALVTATAVTLGLLISSITYTVVESVELAMYAFFISVLTTGIIAPLETAYKYFAYIMKATPFYYAVDASRRVNMTNAGWPQIASNIYILIGFFVGFCLLSLLLLRREAK